MASRNSMAKPLISHGNFELHKLRERDISPFVSALSKENVREFEVLYEDSPYERLIDSLGDDLIHAVWVEGEVLAITGVYEGVFWIMFSREIVKHWRGLVRAAPKLVQFYHNFHDELTCDIWSENKFTLNWATNLGFDPQGVYDDEGGNAIVHFVRCNHLYTNVGSEPSRPVMH